MAAINYDQLGQVLLALKFSREVDSSGPPNWIYRHPSGASIMIPVFPDSDPVLARHLAAVQGTLKLSGVASMADFDAELQKAG